MKATSFTAHPKIDPETGEDVAEMEEGELLVRGYGLMHGYEWHAAELYR